MRKPYRFPREPWLLLALAGCSRGEIPAPLHERPRFSGTVRVEVEAQGARRRLEADLAFDRSNGNFQVAVREGGHTVALNRLKSGELRRFVDGVPAGAAARGARDPAVRTFELLERLCRPPGPETRIEPWERGYAVVEPGRRVRVELEEARGVHGSGRPGVGRSPPGRTAGERPR